MKMFRPTTILALALVVLTHSVRAQSPCDGTAMTMNAPNTNAWVVRLLDALVEE